MSSSLFLILITNHVTHCQLKTLNQACSFIKIQKRGKRPHFLALKESTKMPRVANLLKLFVMFEV